MLDDDTYTDHPVHELATRTAGRSASALVSWLTSIAINTRQSCCCEARNMVQRALGLDYRTDDDESGTHARALVTAHGRLRVGQELPMPTGPPTGSRSPYWVRGTLGTLDGPAWQDAIYHGGVDRGAT